MNLDMFYSDENQTQQNSRPNDFYFKDAIQSISSDPLTKDTSIQSYYETKMWQWFDLYRYWVATGKSTQLVDQPTLEECSQEVTNHFRSIFKSFRQNQVDNLKVTVDGLVFDGDEISRARMVTAIVSSIDDNETVKWSMADNTVADVTSLQLKEALRLSGKQMESIWFQE